VPEKLLLISLLPYSLNIPILPAGEAGAGLGDGVGHLTVAAYHGTGEELVQTQEKEQELLVLLRRARVGGSAARVEPSLIADADGAAVVGAAVGTHLEQLAVLRDVAVAADVEVIAHGAETTATVVAHELLGGVVAVLTGSGAVEDDVPHTVRRLHHGTVFHAGEQLSLADDLVIAYEHWKTVGHHSASHSFHTRCYRDCPYRSHNELNDFFHDLCPVESYFHTHLFYLLSVVIL